jgi:LacI family transcriptional regulator
MRPVTLKDIAERAGVSKVAVSAALSGRPGTVFLSEDTRKRVHAIADELGYTPNGAARALATGRTHLIEFWSQNVNNPFFNSVFHSARHHLLQRSYSTILFETAMPGRPKNLPGWPADGVMVFDFAAHRAQLKEMLASRGFTGLPFVTAGSYFLETHDHVAVDLRGGVAEAVAHLRSAGARRIAYLVDGPSRFTLNVRYSAFLDALARIGDEVEVVEVENHSRAAAREGIREHVAAHGAPDALLCHDDVLAVGANRGLRDIGIRVPDDLLLVGCDGTEEVEYLECPLTTIVQPVDDICEQAARFLVARIEDPSLPLQSATLPVRLAIRRSTSP